MRKGGVKKASRFASARFCGGLMMPMIYDVLMLGATCALFGAMAAVLKAVDNL